MSMSPENYAQIRSEFHNVANEAACYLNGTASNGAIIPMTLQTDIRALMNKISRVEGKCFLGKKNLKTEQIKPTYQEMIDILNGYLKELEKMSAF